MYRYVVPWLPANASPGREAAYYLVAALFAYHPASTKTGNMGSHLARTRDPQGENDALERRFTALLSAHPDDLPFYLRQAISFLKSKDDEPVNWSQLLTDLEAWGNADRYVQQRWAREFWSSRHASQPLDKPNNPDLSTSSKEN
jgi:CRISPR system Cascade subunit CasB